MVAQDGTEAAGRAGAAIVPARMVAARWKDYKIYSVLWLFHAGISVFWVLKIASNRLADARRGACGPALEAISGKFRLFQASKRTLISTSRA
jgi:hypothetical protein